MALPGAVGDGFGGKVEELLGIKETGSAVLPALAEASRLSVARVPGVPKTADERQVIETLVDALLAGPRPTELVEAVIPRMEIGMKEDADEAADWKWGKFMAWEWINESLWKMAEETKDAELAQRYARAAVMLAAMNDVSIRWWNVAQLVNEPEKSAALLGLSKETFEKLRTLVDERAIKEGRAMQQTMEVGKLMDAITQERGKPVPDGAWTEMLSGLDKAFREGVPQLGDRYEVILKAWSVLNLMRSRGSAAGMAAVHGQLAKWMADFPDPDIGRWIGQALTREGPAPGQQVGILHGRGAIVNPNAGPSQLP
jgi:hypothetical protein